MLIVLILGATAVAFRPSLGGAFLNWDDDRNFIHNESFQGLGWQQLRWAWSTYHLGVWQPLSWLLLSLEYVVFGGLDPKAFHAASLLLHGVNSCLLYLLMLAFLRIASPQVAALRPGTARLCAAAAASLFAVHPLRVEVVAWLSCQPYLPAAAFYLLALLAYLRGLSKERSPASHLFWLGLAFAVYLLAVMSKAVAVSVPAVLLILDLYPLRRLGGAVGWFTKRAIRVWIEKLPFLAVAAIVSVWAAHAKDYSETRAPFAFAALDARLAQSAYGLSFYLWKTLAPTVLLPYYDLPKELSLRTWPFGACAVGVIAMTAGLLLARRRWPSLLAAWLAYLVILIPNLGLVQISQQLATDRYSYLAIMPLMILLAGGLFRFLTVRRRAAMLLRFPVMAGLALSIALLTAASRRQSVIWRDSVSLWQATLNADPGCAVAECNLGVAFQERADLAEASLHLSRAIELEPGFAFAWANFGTLLYQAGRYEDSAAALERALALGPDLANPDLAKIHATIGAAYAALRRDDLAWQHSLKAQELGFKDAAKMLDYLRQFSPRPPSGRHPPAG